MIKSIRATLGLRPGDAGPTAAAAARGAWTRGKNASRPVTEAEAQSISDHATAECVLDRVRFLKGASRTSEAYALQRQSWRMGRSRQEMVALAMQACRDDEAYCNLVAAADSARDEGRWIEAEALYGRALHLYEPLAGYRVQYAHMLKEQDRFGLAEVNYRDALAWGAPPADVTPHLDFVRHRQGHHGPPMGDAGACEGPLGEAPTVLDIESLAYAIWREPALSVEDLLDFLRTCSTGDAVAARMLADDRFVYRNGPLLQLLSARP